MRARPSRPTVWMNVLQPTSTMTAPAQARTTLPASALPRRCCLMISLLWRPSQHKSGQQTSAPSQYAGKVPVQHPDRRGGRECRMQPGRPRTHLAERPTCQSDRGIHHRRLGQIRLAVKPGYDPVAAAEDFPGHERAKILRAPEIAGAYPVKEKNEAEERQDNPGGPAHLRRLSGVANSAKRK